MKQPESALSPQQRLEGDLKRAMKAREQERVQTLRMLLSAVKNRRIELGAELDEAELLTLVKRAAKQRREAAEQFYRGGREELAAQEERELLILEEYLPAQIDEQTLRTEVAKYVAAEGLSGPRAIGQVMPVMIERFQGAADGKLLSRIVREALGV